MIQYQYHNIDRSFFMFKDCNTNNIQLLRVFSATINESELNKEIFAFGETDFYQLGIKLNGKTEVRYNSTKMDYSDGSVLYLPKENTDDITYNKTYIAPGSSICIFFTSEYPLISVAKVYNECKASTIQLFYDILSAYRHGDTLKAKALFYGILFELDNEESKHNTDVSFNVISEYINSNISSTDIDVSVLAECYGCSTEHFRHKFRKEFNISPKKYILISRLNLAKELLLNSNLSIADIAQQTGFSDSNYFSRYFKRNTGYTPTQFKSKGKKFL